VKWYLSPTAYHELRDRLARDEHLQPRDHRHSLVRSAMGIDLIESAHFPQHLECDACKGSGSGGKHSTWCLKCTGAGAAMIDGAMVDHAGFRMQLLTRPLPKRFAIPFPPEITVPAAPMRGRIKELRLP
jgi:hypothetical protein